MFNTLYEHSSNKPYLSLQGEGQCLTWSVCVSVCLLPHFLPPSATGQQSATLTCVLLCNYHKLPHTHTPTHPLAVPRMCSALRILHFSAFHYSQFAMRHYKLKQRLILQSFRSIMCRFFVLWKLQRSTPR